MTATQAPTPGPLSGFQKGDVVRQLDWNAITTVDHVSDQGAHVGVTLDGKYGVWPASRFAFIGRPDPIIAGEEWRADPRHDGYYVSDYGRMIGKSGKVLKPIGRYLHVKTSALPRCNIYVHEAVAAAFIGPRPNGQYVRHLDGDRANNTRSNIAYGTPAQNTDDARQHGTMSRGEAHAHSTLTEAQVLEIRAAGKTNRDVLAERYGVHRVTIEKIIGRRAWKHV